MKRFSTSAMKCSVRARNAAATTRGRPAELAATKSYDFIDEKFAGGLRKGADAMITA